MTPIPDLELAPFGVRTPVKTAFVKDIIRALGETIWVPEGLTLPEATIRAEAAFTAWAAFAPNDPVEMMLAEPAQMSMQREATPIEATAEAAGPTQSWQVRKARIVATAPIRAFWSHDHAPDSDMLAAWKEAVRQGTALIDAEDAAEALAT